MSKTAHWLVLAPAGDSEEAFVWMRLNAQAEPEGARGEVTAAQLTTLAARYPDDACCLLVPVSALAIERVHLPGRHDAAGLRALPWLVEEKLAGTMEHMVTVPLARAGENIWVAALEQSQLTRWQAPFQAASLRLEKIIPDALALPLHDDAPSALRWRDGWLVRTAGWQGTQVDDNWLTLWLTARQRECPDEKPLRCYGDAPPGCNDWQVQPQQDAFMLLACEAVRADISLLPKPVSHARWAWRQPLYAAVAMLVLLFTWQGLGLWQLMRQGDALEQQVRQQVGARFPGESQANWQAVVRRAMAQQRGGEFALWMAALPPLPEGVTVREFSWRSEALRLVLNGEAAGLARAQQRLAEAFTLERQRDGAFLLTLKDES
ncbi:hypothetical protein GWD52_03245 [Enterobacteriaceae bacterium 4M9]|nr:hypothetical protein [Enterobacteriaceae bacterium 4M9]